MITWLELWPLETEAGEYWQVSLFFLPPRSHPQLHNSGPSSIGEAELHVGWPSRFRDENLLYAMEIKTDGPVSCRTNTSLNPHGLQVTWNIQCAIHRAQHTYAAKKQSQERNVGVLLLTRMSMFAHCAFLTDYLQHLLIQTGLATFFYLYH